MVGYCHWVQSQHAPPAAEPLSKATAQEPLQIGELRNVEASINDMIPIAGRMLASIWNLEMKALIAVGAMAYFVKYPWLLFLLAFLLLAIFLPLGVIFSLTGMAAIHYDAKAEDQFLVRLDPVKCPLVGLSLLVFGWHFTELRPPRLCLSNMAAKSRSTPSNVPPLTVAASWSEFAMTRPKEYMVILLRGTYYHYCKIDQGTVDALLGAEFMGRYFQANIRGSGSDGPFDCRTHRVPEY